MRFYLVLFFAAIILLPLAMFVLRSLLPWLAMMSVALLVVVCVFAARRINKTNTQ
ncbi:MULTISPECIES: hypothetical protein [Pirellulaceae]|uniref:hypothetical protein n=1 Tax=Pirellulaceae TaxID=2691357 RepID=UPI0013050055|nr:MULTISPECIES: hypothetical protein [Pirellulaceae]